MAYSSDDDGKRDKRTPRTARPDENRSPSSQLHRSAPWRKLQHEYRLSCKALQLPCAHCGEAIDYTAKPGAHNSFEADHVKSVATHPHLMLLRSNLQPAHARCNRSAGGKLGREIQQQTRRERKSNVAPANKDWIPADWPNDPSEEWAPHYERRGEWTCQCDKHIKQVG